MNRILWPIFSRLIEQKKCQGTFYKVPHGFLTVFVQMIRSFFFRPKRSTETNVSKISRFNGDKKLWPIFPRIVECDKHQGLVY